MPVALHIQVLLNFPKFVLFFYKFKILESIGTSAPKFGSNSESLGVFKAAMTESFNFVCPAQSSPVPSFRSVVINHFTGNHFKHSATIFH